MAETPDFYLVWLQECTADEHSLVLEVFCAESFAPFTTTACVHCGARPSILADH